MGHADVVVVDAGGVALEAGAAVAGADVVAEEPEPSLGGTSHTWGWQEGQKNCGDKFDQTPAESMGQRRHGTLRSALLDYEDPGGRVHSKCNCGTMGEQ